MRWGREEEGTRGGAGGEGDVFKASPLIQVTSRTCPPSHPPEQPPSTRPQTQVSADPRADPRSGKTRLWKSRFSNRSSAEVGGPPFLEAGLLVLPAPGLSGTRMETLRV